MDVYVEIGVGGHIDDATQAWSFDQQSWGRCGQGSDEKSALADLFRQLPEKSPTNCRIVERIHGAEHVFDRDQVPALAAEREITKQILADCRAATIAVLSACSQTELTWIDPARSLPRWATWHSLEAMGWHLLETESDYYLARLGLEPVALRYDLFAELAAGVNRIATAIYDLPPVHLEATGTEQWTPVKILRRLAWHERSELVTIRELATKARKANQPPRENA